jgi:hypothetical protein
MGGLRSKRMKDETLQNAKPKRKVARHISESSLWCQCFDLSTIMVLW